MRNRIPYAPPLQPRPGDGASHGFGLAIVAAVAAATGAFVTALLLFPESLALRATVTSLLLGAAAMAAIAWMAPAGAGRVRLVFWDTAGLMTMIGLAAALIGEPEPTIALLERGR
jgi:hypothetical protein